MIGLAASLLSGSAIGVALFNHIDLWIALGIILPAYFAGWCSYIAGWGENL
jgi:hypothetical protein